MFPIMMIKLTFNLSELSWSVEARCGNSRLALVSAKNLMHYEKKSSANTACQLVSLCIKSCLSKDTVNDFDVVFATISAQKVTILVCPSVIRT